MGIIRKIGAALLLVAAVIVYFAMAPEDSSEQGAQSERASIESQDQLNNGLAEGAPQQAVVNGWTTNDYLGLLSNQIEDAAAGPQRDERPAALLLLGVAGLSLIALTTERPSVVSESVPAMVTAPGGTPPDQPVASHRPQASPPVSRPASPYPDRPVDRPAPTRSDQSEGSE